MVWPVRSCQALKVSISMGAEPEMNSRMEHQARGGQARLGQQAHIQRGHAHEHRGLWQLLQHHLGVELGKPDHLAAIDQRAVDGHKQAVHMEDGQRMQQHVAALLWRAPAPVALQHLGVGQQVAVRQHGPLAAPGRAAGVDDGGQVIGLDHCAGVCWRGTLRRALQQAAAAVIVQA